MVFVLIPFFADIFINVFLLPFLLLLSDTLAVTLRAYLPSEYCLGCGQELIFSGPGLACVEH